MKGRFFRCAALSVLVPCCFGVAQTTENSGLTAVAHIALRVSDVDAELRFLAKLGYEEAFVHQENGRMAFSFVKVNDREFLEIHPRIPLDGKAPLPLGFNHICFVTDDAGAEHALWTQKGLNPSAVTKGPDGTLEFGAKDPAGSMTEALQIPPDSQPGRDVGKHLGPNRVSSWLSGIELPVSDLATWRNFYEAIGFTATIEGPVVRLSSPANPRLQVVLQTSQRDERASLLFLVEDSNNAARDLKSAGLQAEANDRQVTVRDPDGNLFVLRQELVGR